MNIFISVPEEKKRWFFNISNLLVHSLKDLGHNIASLEESEVVIAVRYFPSFIEKEEGKKYILLQTEQFYKKNVNIEKLYKFADTVWGFGIDSKTENYLVLGYHPCLEMNEIKIEKDINVSFFGCVKTRRKQFFNSVNYKPEKLNTWDFKQKIKNIKRSKINLNYHSFTETDYTEWDRICLMLANKSFILSEKFYCPLKINQFNTVNEYNDAVKYYLCHDKERQEIANNLYEEYKIKYDMRNILQKELKSYDKN